MFGEYYKNKTSKTLNMKYNTYFQYFRKNSPYSFRKPRTDTCDMCEKFKIKLQVDPNDNQSRNMLTLHERKVAAYKELKNKIISEANIESDSLVIEFDYGQNLPLPKLTVTSLFYKRQMWYYVFNIHCHNDDNSTMYTYLETEGTKDPDTVASFLYDFICKRIGSNKNIKEIILMSDNCGGQNKSYKMMMFCSFLAIKFQVRVSHLYPVRGHSYCQCDRNFGAYSNVLHRIARIPTAKDYNNVISSKCDMVEGYGIMKKWSESLAENFIKYNSIVSRNTHFKIQQYCRLQYNKSGTIAASMCYHGVFIPFSFLLRGVDLSTFDLDTVKVMPRNILKPAKEKDVRSLFCFLTTDECKWFEDVIEKPKQINEEVAEYPDVEEDEESDCEAIIAYEFPNDA